VSQEQRERRSLENGFKHGQHAAEIRVKNMYHPGADTGRFSADWPTIVITSPTITRMDWRNLAARSELAFRTTAIGRRAIQCLKTFTIGSGLKPYPNITDDNGEQVQNLNDVLRRHWQRFDDECMRVGGATMSFTEAQALEFQNISVLGASLTNIVKSRPGSWLPFAFQIIKPTHLNFSVDNWWGSIWETMPKNPIINGIRRNDFMEPIEFYFLGETEPRLASTMQLHFMQLEAEQYLGMPWLSPVLPNLWDDQQLFDDKMKQSRILTQMGIWEKKQDRNDIGLTQEFDSERNESYTPLDGVGLWTGDNKPEAIQLDDKLAEAFQAIVKLNLLKIGMGLGFSYQLLTSDLEGMNFAASRANKISDTRFFRSMKNWYSNTCCAAKWKKFVEWEVIAGRVPGLSYSQYLKDPWKYSQCNWLPEGEDWVDPMKDVQSKELLRNMGAITMQELCAERGVDMHDQIKKLALEKKLLISSGLPELVPVGMALPASASGSGSGQNVDASTLE
jgi:capsid protein